MKWKPLEGEAKERIENTSVAIIPNNDKDLVTINVCTEFERDGMKGDKPLGSVWIEKIIAWRVTTEIHSNDGSTLNFTTTKSPLLIDESVAGDEGGDGVIIYDTGNKFWCINSYDGCTQDTGSKGVRDEILLRYRVEKWPDILND